MDGFNKQETIENYKIGYRRQSAGSLFWRRVAFIYRYGSKHIISCMESFFDKHPSGWGEVASTKEMEAMNKDLMKFWEPVSLMKNAKDMEWRL